MIQENPFSTSFDTDQDVVLIRRAVEGHRAALDALLQRHQNFIYNIAIKMLGSVADAQDVTQEVLIKVITNLSSYDAQKAQFRTWLYRIAFNFILNYKKSSTEERIVSFSQFFDFVDDVPDDDRLAEETDEADILSEETKIKCMTGMLMCVSREDRLLYIVGDLFGIDHNLGAELFDVSKSNFRKKLSRIRHDLRQWMNNKCGLVNHDNPCRCARKTKGFVERGIVDPDHLIWDKGFTQKINAFTEDHMQDALRSSDTVYSHLYRTHPFKEQAEAHDIIEEIISDKNFQHILNL